jgi:hypothetical protein
MFNSTEVPASKICLLPGVESSVSRGSARFLSFSPFPLEETGDQTFAKFADILA